MSREQTDRKILRWLAALDSSADIATTAEIMAALGMSKTVAWPACERMEKTGEVVWCHGSGDRPGGWSATYAGRESVKAEAP